MTSLVGELVEVEPIEGLALGLERVTNPDPEGEWLWAYVLSLFIVRFSFVKFK